jgi:uncharacterized repeat protein (TIGR02543 family)
MKTKNNFRGLLVKLPFVLAVVLLFALVGCGDSDDPGGNNASQLPSALQNTNWVHTGGDKVQFGTNTVTVIPASGSSRTFTLKSSINVSELSRTTLYFGDSQTADFIVYENGTVSSVGLGGVQKTGGWQRDNGGGNPQPNQCTITFNAAGGTVTPSSKQVNSGDPAGDLPTPTRTNYTFGGWYTAQNGGGTVFTSVTPVTGNIIVYAKWTIIEQPVEISKNVQLSEENWKAILTEIETAGKYVNLNLSSCTRSTAYSGGGLRSGGTFDPINNFSTGKNKIVSLVLPNTAMSIINGSSSNPSFKDFSNLESLSAPAVTTIGEYAFSGCTSLISVSLPQATSIVYAFYGCTSLTSVSLPQATIIASAFSGCTSLTSVSLPQATSIDYNAFYGCTSLTSISLPQVTSIDSSAFSNCTSLTSISLPQVTSIRYAAFWGCTSLASISLPQVTSIDTSAFSICTSLTSISLPQATSIGDHAFSNCTNLSSVSLPKVISIDKGAFRATSNIALTITLGQNAPTLGGDIFSYISSAKTITVKVPTGAIGYGEIPKTYSGTDTTVNWGNGFRGGGWTGTEFVPVGADEIRNYNYITLHVVYQE